MNTLGNTFDSLKIGSTSINSDKNSLNNFNYNNNYQGGINNISRKTDNKCNNQTFRDYSKTKIIDKDQKKEKKRQEKTTYLLYCKIKREVDHCVDILNFTDLNNLNLSDICLILHILGYIPELGNDDKVAKSEKLLIEEMMVYLNKFCPTEKPKTHTQKSKKDCFSNKTISSDQLLQFIPAIHGLCVKDSESFNQNPKQKKEKINFNYNLDSETEETIILVSSTDNQNLFNTFPFSDHRSNHSQSLVSNTDKSSLRKGSSKQDSITTFFNMGANTQKNLPRYPHLLKHSLSVNKNFPSSKNHKKKKLGVKEVQTIKKKCKILFFNKLHTDD